MTTMTSSLTSFLAYKPQRTYSLFESSFHGISVSLRLQPMKAIHNNQHGFSVSMSSTGSNPPYDLKSFKFEPIKESIVSRDMTRRYMTDMITYVHTDVIVMGAGSAGLSCAYELRKNPNLSVGLLPLLNSLLALVVVLGSVASSSLPWNVYICHA